MPFQGRPIPRQAEDDVCRHLRQRIVLSLAIESSFVAVLSEAAEDCRRAGDEIEARRLADLVHSHRVGVGERRAILGAAGIVI